jgi:hypothetical protein
VSRCQSHLIVEASRKLGLSNRRIYALLDAFRQNPVTTSLLPRKPGPKKGARQLNAAVDAQIETAIDEVYRKREQPTLRKVLRQAARNCRAARLNPPSVKALRAGVSARSLRERIKAREGAKVRGAMPARNAPAPAGPLARTPRHRRDRAPRSAHSSASARGVAGWRRGAQCRRRGAQARHANPGTLSHRSAPARPGAASRQQPPGARSSHPSAP